MTPTVADPAAAGKQRRQKIIVGCGVLLLVLLLAIQGPRMLRGSPAAAPTGTTVAPASTDVAPTSSGAASQSLAAVLAAEQRPVRDDGRSPDSASASRGTPVAAVTTPASGTAAPSLAGVLAAEHQAVRNVNRLYEFDRFTYADPFTGSSDAAPAQPAPDGRGAPARGRNLPKVKGSWTVVVHSLPMFLGRAHATSVARSVSVRLNRPVGVLRSSSRANLRAGFYLVYTGAFRTRTAARDALRAARAINPTAYTRFVDA